jgi:hypothetical protein
LCSVHIENGVAICVLKVVTLAQFEIDESLHFLLVVNIDINWVLKFLNGFEMGITWERGEDLWSPCLVRVLESQEHCGKVLEVFVFPEHECSE